MDLREFIPGTTWQRDAQRRKNDEAEQSRERWRTEINEWREAQKQAWIDRQPEYYEAERVALEAIWAFKRKLLDGNDFTQSVSGRLFRHAVDQSNGHQVSLVEFGDDRSLLLHVEEQEFPSNRSIIDIRRHEYEILPVKPLYKPNGELSDVSDRVVKNALFGYNLIAIHESIVDIGSSLSMDFSGVARQLEESFGPLE